MTTYINKYRGYTIHIEIVSEDEVNYHVEKEDKSIVNDTSGSCVSVEEALDTCKEMIDDLLDY